MTNCNGCRVMDHLQGLSVRSLTCWRSHSCILPHAASNFSFTSLRAAGGNQDFGKSFSTLHTCAFTAGQVVHSESQPVSHKLSLQDKARLAGTADHASKKSSTCGIVRPKKLFLPVYHHQLSLVTPEEGAFPRNEGVLKKTMYS